MLLTGVFYLSPDKESVKGEKLLRDALTMYNCDKIGIGNGKGCRETEQFLSGLIKKGIFSPLKVEYW